MRDPVIAFSALSPPRRSEERYTRHIDEDKTEAVPGQTILGFHGTAARYHTYVDHSRRRVVDVRRTPRKGVHLNLLDHGGVITRRKRGMAVLSAAFGLGLQGILFAGLLGLAMAGVGMGMGGWSLYQQLRPFIGPVVDAIEPWLDFARAQGLPVDKLEEKLEGQFIKHLFPKRILKYALITVFAGGMGTFWAGAASLAVLAVYADDILQSALMAVQALALAKTSFETVADDLLNYRYQHHPELIKLRIEQGLSRYREMIAEDEAEKAHARDPENLKKDYVQQISTSYQLLENTLAALKNGGPQPAPAPAAEPAPGRPEIPEELQAAMAGFARSVYGR